MKTSIWPEAIKWIGVMRHAASWHEGMDPEKQSRDTAELTIEGERAAIAVSGRFCEFLKEMGIDPSTVAVHHVGTPQTIATATVLQDKLLAGANDPCQVGGSSARVDKGNLNEDDHRGPDHPLAPRELPAYVSTSDDLTDAWSHVVEQLHGGSHVLVGHDPQASWIANRLLRADRRSRWPLAAKAPQQRIALAPGELVWLKRSEQGALLQWIFSPSDSDTTSALHDKIKSKMDTAKVFGAFLTGLFAFAAREIATMGPMALGFGIAAAIGMALMAIAVVLFFVTMFRYDELLMPTRFWASGPLDGVAHSGDFVRRPPGSSVWLLYQNMIHVWDHAFVPAMQFAGAGLVLLVVVFVQPLTPLQWIGIGASVLGVALGTLKALNTSRLRLGVND